MTEDGLTLELLDRLINATADPLPLYAVPGAGFLHGFVLEPARLTQRTRGCFAACVAMLSGIPLEELDQGIPPDASEAWRLEHAERLYGDMQRKLQARGLLLLALSPADVPAGYAMATGLTAEGAAHAVVVNGGALWHDPAPGGKGLASVWCFQVLVRKPPARGARRGEHATKAATVAGAGAHDRAGAGGGGLGSTAGGRPLASRAAEDGGAPGSLEALPSAGAPEVRPAEQSPPQLGA